MSAMVRWRSPVMLGPEAVLELPSPLVDVLEELFAGAPLPADGGDLRSRQRAVRQATTLLRLYEGRRARERARDRRLAADYGLVAASAERHLELAKVERWAREDLRLQATWAVLHDDCGPCEPAHVALAAGLTAAELDVLIATDRDRSS